MAKLNWEKTQTQSRSYKYGLEIDPRVGTDPNKIPKYRYVKKRKTGKTGIVLELANIVPSNIDYLETILHRLMALYAVSVRRLIALRSGFLQTPPRGDALAFG